MISIYVNTKLIGRVDTEAEARAILATLPAGCACRCWDGEGRDITDDLMLGAW